MIFSKSNDKTLPNSFPSILLNGQSVEKVENFKYLGGILDSNLSYRGHCQHVENKTVAAVARLLSFKRLLPFHVFRISFFAYIISISDLCLLVWGAVLESNSECKIQRHLDRLLQTYFYPTISRKRNLKKVTPFVLWDKIGVNTLKERYETVCVKLVNNFLTTDEQHKWTYPPNWFSVSDRISSRKIPLLKVCRIKSKASERSIKSSCTRIWNSLPRESLIFLTGLVPNFSRN